MMDQSIVLTLSKEERQALRSFIKDRLSSWEAHAKQHGIVDPQQLLLRLDRPESAPKKD